jgi:hypothetical protein
MRTIVLHWIFYMGVIGLLNSCIFREFGYIVEFEKHTIIGKPSPIRWISVEDVTAHYNETYTPFLYSGDSIHAYYINAEYKESIHFNNLLAKNAKAPKPRRYREYTPLLDSMQFFLYDLETGLIDSTGVPSYSLFQANRYYVISMLEAPGISPVSFEIFVALDENRNICQWVQRKMFIEPSRCGGLR